MSESVALLRRRRTDELGRLADEHLQHDLQSEDRDKLKAAASSISLWTTVGSALGLGLGLFAGIRLRSTRRAFFAAVRAQEKPTQVVFANGRTESIPDLTPLLKPSALGDFATYFFASLGGLFLGGELGLAGGAASGSSTISSDPESKKRIENAFRKFRADVLRKEADSLDKGADVSSEMF